MMTYVPYKPTYVEQGAMYKFLEAAILHPGIACRSDFQDLEALTDTIKELYPEDLALFLMAVANGEVEWR